MPAVLLAQFNWLRSLSVRGHEALSRGVNELMLPILRAFRGVLSPAV